MEVLLPSQAPPLRTHKQILPHKFNEVLLKLQHLHSTGSTTKNKGREEAPALSREWMVCGARTAHQQAPGRQLPAGQDSRRGRKKLRRNQYLGRFTSTLEETEGQESGEDAGQAAPPPPHPELSTDGHTVTLQKVEGPSRDHCTYPSASNFFLFSMICRENTKSCYPQGIWLLTGGRGAGGCQIHLRRAAACQRELR